MSDHHQTPRKIIGFSMSPSMAFDVKDEAQKREISLRNLFEQMWSLYNNKKNTTCP